MVAPDAALMWGMVLAGGGGTRLRPLTRRIAGDERPKQFCRVLSGETLVEQTLRRTARLLALERTLVVVVRAHEPFYAPLLAHLPADHLVVQPENRGTAPAVLYGLLRLGTLAPKGPVAILPSDHFVSDDDVFMAHVKEAFDVVRTREDLVVLLGIEPDTAEVEYGWIEPGEPIAGPWASQVYRVHRFWEKPSPALTPTLRGRGCLWSSFVMVAYPSALIALIRSAVPALFDEFASVRSRLGTPWEDEAFRRLYARWRPTDLSTRVLTTRPAHLAVLRAGGMEWSDLGDPRRVMATLARIRQHSAQQDNEVSA